MSERDGHRLGSDAAHDVVEHGQLLASEVVVGLVFDRAMGPDAAEHELRTSVDGLCEVNGLIGRATHAVHARVDLQMHRPHRRTWRPQHDAERFLDATARVHRGLEVGFERGRHRVERRFGEHDDASGDAGLAKRDAFLDESDGEHRRARLERATDASSAPWP